MNLRRSYTIRAWCDENGAEGTYRLDAVDEMAARRQAAEEFREHCICAAALHVPAARNVHTAVVSE